MNKYLITLTPVGRFFFGGDATFSVSGKKKFNEKYSSYIIESSYFPQQTSLLGMLRFTILSGDKEAFSGSKIINTKKAVDLIGETSFSVNQPNHESKSFGEIINLSPCLLQIKEEGSVWKSLQPAPIGSDYEVHIGDSISYVNGKAKYISKIIKRQNVSIVEAKKADEELYSAKNGFSKKFCYGDKTILLGDIFCKDRRVGINKDYSGKNKDSSYFKLISYRFNDKLFDLDAKQTKIKDDKGNYTFKQCQYRFAFEVTVQKDCEIIQHDGKLVSIGGENSQFIINIESSEAALVIDADKSNSCLSFDEKQAYYAKIILTSPAYIENEVVEDNCCFAITETQSFRFLKTKTDKEICYNISSQKVMRSQKYSLFSTGSVFYLKNEKDFKVLKKTIDSKKEFIQIGYNHYYEIYNK